MSKAPAKFLLHPVGSAGDVYPFVALGLALKARGHEVTILTSGYFEEVVRRVGLDFVDTLAKDEFIKLTESPELWTRMKGAPTLLRSFTSDLIGRCFQEIEQRYEPGRTVALSPCIGFGARVAQEKLGLPLATVALQPALLWSKHESPKLDGIVHAAPSWFKQFLFFIAESLFIGPNILPALNSVRHDIGMEKVSRLSQWWLSPQRVLCLFPEWLAPRQPDWSDLIQFSQFPLWNENADESLPNEVEAFLNAGEKPVVFAPGSANRFGDDFFAAAVSACQQSGMRGMLFSRYEDQIPENLPKGVQHFKYAPFQKLLPRCAAISHHGGVGTMANAMSAGIPQLIMPMTYDQPDNARRIARLGVGDFLVRKQYMADLVAEKLSQLVGCVEVANNCRRVAERINAEDPFEQACGVAESLIGTDRGIS